MIPELPQVSSTVVSDEILAPHNTVKVPLKDYARGGKALLDSSDGLNIKNWEIYKEGDKIYIKAEDGDPVEVEDIPTDVTWLSFCFDQNMHYNIAYIRNGVTFWYWYDPVAEKYKDLELGEGYISPMARLDDARKDAQAESDIILSYVKNNNLYCRVQRQRYETEHLIKETLVGQLIRCGMNKKLRFQWEIDPNKR